MEISLVSDVEEHKNNPDTITLMTIHSAKGLEFDNVFIIGLEEGLFPHMNSMDDFDGIEEERRLCYVAVTRARKKLYLVNAKERMIYGQTSSNVVSRFIKEIDKDLLDVDEVETLYKPKKVIHSNIDTTAEYKPGDKVMHDVFGKGMIVSVDKSVVTIAFPQPYGIKTLMKGHSSIKKL